jgi:hypothetical protein
LLFFIRIWFKNLAASWQILVLWNVGNFNILILKIHKPQLWAEVRTQGLLPFLLVAAFCPFSCSTIAMSYFASSARCQAQTRLSKNINLDVFIKN